MRLRKVIFVLLLPCSLLADEGLWLYEHFPAQQVEQKYGFRPGPEFLTHLERSSVRFNNGGSGSFISADGLLFTNHHVGADCIQKLSSAEHDYFAGGFSAVSASEERACPDLEVNVLLKTEDISARVNEGITDSTPVAEAGKMRRSALARIEKECVAATKNRCDGVTLYAGGQYSLYQYKKYTDVRLVFAPEYAIAAFGGDPDNFTYPRYDLDFSLFRAYENGVPAHPEHWLKWSHEGVKEGELTFVSGHPGSTGRLQTVAQLEFARDHSYPLTLDFLKQVIDRLLRFQQESPEHKRISEEVLQGTQNSYKAISGFERGLKDPALMARKREDEEKLKRAIAADPRKQAQFGKLWNEIAAAYQEYAGIYKPYFAFELNTGDSDLLLQAKRLVRYAVEKAKPNEQRLRAYQDAGLPALEQGLFSPAPMHRDLEQMLLAEYFRFLQRTIGGDDPVIRRVLNGKSPEAAAADYISRTKLDDVGERKNVAASAEAARNSKDGMLELAWILDEPARRYRKQYEDKVEAVILSSSAKLQQARFAVYGANEYPDATFTLRLTYGPVKGYHNSRGDRVPYATSFAGLYRRATGKEPYRLPERWLKSKPALNLATPFDFVTTCDIHGGNSGSPTVNTRDEIVGIVFDGNLEGLPNRFLYTEDQARAIHVASNAIIEALRKVYHADRILQELGFGQGAAAAPSGQ